MSHHPKTVLIIDDEEDLRDTVGYKFKAAGYTVVTAIDGVDWLEKLADLEPDLIILDVNMPRMNGLEFYQRIKGPDDRTKYPVLILTARANMENLFHDLDADGFMAKPFELDDLLQTAEQIILSNSGVLHNESTVGVVRARRICIVEDNPKIMQKLSLGFLCCGYVVQIAHSGSAAIRRMKLDPPDVAVINMLLRDISGDILVGKLVRENIAQNFRIVLYSSREADVDKTVITSTIAHKDGVDKYVPSDDFSDILPAVNGVF